MMNYSKKHAQSRIIQLERQGSSGEGKVGTPADPQQHSPKQTATHLSKPQSSSSLSPSRVSFNLDTLHELCFHLRRLSRHSVSHGTLKSGNIRTITDTNYFSRILTTRWEPRSLTQEFAQERL